VGPTQVTEHNLRVLSEQYIPTANDDRYTYTSGSTPQTMVLMGACCTRATDDPGGGYRMFFDLVGLRLFGHLDDTYGTQKKP
jgi:hypothetical protein